MYFISFSSYIVIAGHLKSLAISKDERDWEAKRGKKSSLMLRK